MPQKDGFLDPNSDAAPILDKGLAGRKSTNGEMASVCCFVGLSGPRQTALHH